jgi:hypothetical protein
VSNAVSNCLLFVLQEQLKNEKSVSAAALSLIKLAEYEFKCNLSQSENIISILIKQIEAKDRALQSKNEKLVQMQAIIEGLKQKEEA